MRQGQIALFFLAIFLFLLAILVEAGATQLLGPAGELSANGDLQRPGIGIAYLALLDSVLLYTLATIASDFVAPLRAALGKFQWLITFILAIIGLISTLLLVMAAIALLSLMVTLLLAAPFGTIAYIIAWGSFATGKAKLVLGLIMSLKLFGTLLVLLAYPTLLKNRSMMAILASSIGATFLLGFLHAFVPGILVSITDAAGALVFGLIAAVWMLIFLIGSVPAFMRSLRSTI
jgi:hypothetical protein